MLFGSTPDTKRQKGGRISVYNDWLFIISYGCCYIHRLKLVCDCFEPENNLKVRTTTLFCIYTVYNKAKPKTGRFLFCDKPSNIDLFILHARIYFDCRLAKAAKYS